MGYTVFAILIIAAAAAGLLFKMNGELAGIGRPAKRGGLRAPHGALVRTKRLDQIEETPFLSRFGILLAIGVASTIIFAILTHLIVTDAGSNMFVGVHFALCVAVTVGVSYADSGIWGPLAYALGGYLVGAALVSVCWAFGILPFGEASIDDVNMITVCVAALCCALSVSFMPTVYSYAREFEDGHVNAIQVSSRSVARKAYDAVLDPSWKPPADRIKDYRAVDDLRSYQEKRGDRRG